MSRVIKISSLAALIFSLLACDLNVPTEGNLPTWYTDIYVPLGVYTKSGRDLLQNDSLITDVSLSLNEDSVYTYQDSVTLDTFRIGNELQFDDIHKSFSYALDQVRFAPQGMQTSIQPEQVSLKNMSRSATSQVGPIQLEDTDPTSSDNFAFREIMPSAQVNSMETAISTNGGIFTFDNIPAYDLEQSQRDFAFDSFQYVVLSDGLLDLTIVNEMFMPLGSPIQISLRYTDGSEFAAATFSDPVPVNSGATQTVDLTGDSLACDIIIHVEGHSNGITSPVTLTSSDLDRGFHVEMQSRQLVAHRANARLPQQNIADSDTIPVQNNSDRIQQADISSGDIVVNIANQLHVNSEIILRIPSLTDANGVVFERGPFNVAAQSQTNKSFSLANTTLQMELNDQSIDYEFEFSTENTGNQFTTITSEDSIVANVDFRDVLFSRVRGELAPAVQTDAGSYPLDNDNDILSAVIESGDLAIDIENNIGGAYQLALTLDNLFAQKNSTDTLQQDITLQPGVNHVSIPLDDTEMRLARNDQNFHYSVRLTNEQGLYDYNLMDSIAVNMDLSSVTLSEATGYFSQDVMTQEDTLQINNENRLQDADISSGTMQIAVQNHIGVNASVRMQFNQLFSGSSRFDTTLYISGNPAESTFQFPLDRYRIQMPLDHQVVHYSVKTSLESDSLMTLTFGDSMEVAVNLRDVNFDRVMAEVAPTDYSIDPFEYEVFDIPSEFSSIHLTKADMQIQFESNVELPIMLNLRVKSMNASGDSAVIAIHDWNITDSSTVVIPGAETLLNNVPEKIIASGTATVGGEGVVGLISPDQYATGKLTILVPAEFQISNDAVFTSDPLAVEATGVQDLQSMESIKSITLFTEISNNFTFGAQLDMQAARDSMSLVNGSPVAGDTITTLSTFTIPGSVTSLDSVVLESEAYNTFTDSMYVKPSIRLLPVENSEGTSSFHSTDTLRARVYARIRFLNDFNNDK